MIRPERPDWEIFVRMFGNAAIAVLVAAAAALIVWKLSIWRLIGPTFSLFSFLVTFAVLALVFYTFLEWLRKRPDEIAKKVPTPSSELRRKKKQFFGNLPG